MPVPLVATLLLLCLPVFGQDLEIDPYLPLVLQGQWHPLVWEALVPVRTPDPATYLANLPRPLPVEPVLPLPVVVPLPLADASAAAFARVPGYGFGWASGLAVYDRASALIEAGRHDQARELLKQPVTGPYAEQVAIPLAYLLGYSYRATGDAAEAKRAFGSVIERWATLASPLRGEGLEQIVEQARKYLRELEGAGRGE